MIIVVSGVTTDYHNENNSQYKKEFYQPINEPDLKENIKKDFGDMLSTEMSKLKIDILI